MNEEELQSNPFSALFPSLSVAKSFVDGAAKPPNGPPSTESSPAKKVDLSSDETLKDVHELNNAIEEIFLITLNKFSVLGGEQKQLVYLSSLAEIIGRLIHSLSCPHYLDVKAVTIRTGWTSPPWSRPSSRGSCWTLLSIPSSLTQTPSPSTIPRPWRLRPSDTSSAATNGHVRQSPAGRKERKLLRISFR